MCVELHSDSWEDDFFAELGVAEQDMEATDAPSKDESELDSEHPSSRLENFKEATCVCIQSLEGVQHFLQSRGCAQDVTAIGSTIDTVAHLPRHLSLPPSYSPRGY